MKVRSFKKWVAGAVMAMAALGGPMGPAHAFQFNTGDAVLVLYGGTTEYYLDMGSMASVLTNGFTTSDAGIASAISGGDTKFTVVGVAGLNTADNVLFGDRVAASSWNSTALNSLTSSTIQSGVANWGTGLTLSGSPATPSGTFAKTDANSFTSNIDIVNSDGTMGGALSTTTLGFSTLANPLYLLERHADDSGALMQLAIGRIVNNQFAVSVSAVPVPAAAVLFGTGLIGLAGLARRRVFGA